MSAVDSALLARLAAGDRRALARAISAIENDTPAAAAIREHVAARPRRAHVVGITGPPGAGKSTLIHALLGELIARERTIAVVAVDPSSPITGGAVLGDRVRMGQHGAHERVFIRSIASRGHAGGVAQATAAIVEVLDAAGFDPILVETVGAGQSEVEIARIADTRLVVCPPGLGDEVQAIKAGILEIADLLVVSKADTPAAEAVVRELKDMLRLRHDGAGRVPVLAVSAARGEGIAGLVDAIDARGRTAGNGARRTGPRLAPAERGQPAGADAGRDAVGTASARQRLRRLAETDPFVRLLGIRLVDGGEGFATVEMAVGSEHLNFNGSCHGGVIFALADTAFGLASNSHGRIAAGIDAHITYQVAVRGGERLTAQAREVSRSRRLAVYRVDVTDANRQPVSSFTGTVYVTTRPLAQDAGSDEATRATPDEAGGAPP